MKYMLLGIYLAVLALLFLIYGQGLAVFAAIGVYILPLLSIVFFVGGFSSFKEPKGKNAKSDDDGADKTNPKGK